MKILVKGDSHYKLENQEEILAVHNEIRSYKADMLVDLGDFTHNKKLNEDEHYFVAEEANKFKSLYSEVVMLRGNHPTIRQNFSNIDFLKFQGIYVRDDFEKNNNLYFGHFMTEKSAMCFPESPKTEFYKETKDLVKYHLVLIGHQHQQQELIKGKIYHLGSCIFESFAETDVKQKIIALIDDDGNVKFIPLKTPIPMIEVRSVDDLEGIPARTKVCLTITSIEYYKKHISDIQKKWKTYFHQFKIKYDLPKITQEVTKGKKVDTKNVKEMVIDRLKTIKDKDIKDLLMVEFKAEGLI